MRLIISLNGNGLTINIEGINNIINHGSYILLEGPMAIIVNVYTIGTCDVLRIDKNWLLTVDEVYFDTRLEEATDG